MIKAVSVQQLAALTGGQVAGEAAPCFSRVCTDSRRVQPDDLFVALRGEHFDGHDFIATAAAAGAAAALVDTPQSGTGLPQVVVADTLLALGQLAAFNRDQFQGPVVGVTGSAGKTSVKQLMASVLAQQFSTLMTQGNLNNHIGVPLTLLSLEAGHEAAVVEMGASGRGEIAYTAQWVKPRVGIITNAAEAHIEGFGSLEGVVSTKGELLDFIAADGTAVLNADDAFFSRWCERAAPRRVLSFGFSETADVRATGLQCTLDGSPFRLHYGADSWSVRLPLLGAHNVANALAVAAAGFALGLPAAVIVAGLEQAQAVAGRLQWVQGAQGQRILNDAYNANPASVRAAIDVLKQSANGWLVLGDMAELGDNEQAQHAAIGGYAQAQGIRHLLATGPLSRCTTDAFGAGGHWFATREELVRYLQQQTREQDILLVKGSRSAGMDQVVAALQLTTGDN